MERRRTLSIPRVEKLERRELRESACERTEITAVLLVRSWKNGNAETAYAAQSEFARPQLGLGATDALIATLTQSSL